MRKIMGFFNDSRKKKDAAPVRIPATHRLKTDPEVFAHSFAGNRQWEIRFNDRDFQPGDRVILEETQHSGEEMKRGAPLIYTNREVRGTIAYVMHGPCYGLKEGWVIFSLKSAFSADN